MGEQRRTFRWGLWILVIFLLGLIGGGASLIWRRARYRDYRMVQKGRLLLAADRPKEAETLFRAALKINPENDYARVGLLEALKRRNEFDAALKEIESLPAGAATPEEIARHKADIWVSRGEWRLASAGRALDASLCEAVIREEVDPAIRLIAGLHREAADKAGNAYFLGVLYNKKSAVLLAEQRLLIEKSRREQAMNRPDDAAESTRTAAALLVRARAEQQRATAAFQEAIAIAPEKADEARLALARQYLSRFVPEPRAAEEALKPLLANPPGRNSPRRNAYVEALRLTALAEKQKGNVDAALAAVREAREASGKPTDLALFEADLLVKAERWEEATPLIEKLVKDPAESKKPMVSYLHGRLLLHRGRAEEAVIPLQNIFAVPSRAWPEARLTLGRALEAAGKREQARTAYQDAVVEGQKAVPTDMEEQKAVRETVFEAATILARTEGQKSPTEGLRYAKTAFTTFPQRPDALALVKDALERSRETEDTEQYVAVHIAAVAVARGIPAALAALHAEPAGIQAAPRLRRLQARLLTRNGSFAEAVEVLEQLRKEFPAIRDYALEAAALHTRLGRTDQAATIYRELAAAKPDDFTAFMGLVQALLRKNDLEGARNVIEQARERIGDERVRSLLIGAYLHEGARTHALELVRAQVAATPDNALYQALLGDLLWDRGDPNGARRAYDRAIAVGGKDLLGYRRGLLDLQQGKTADAVALYQQALRIDDKNPLTHLFLAVALLADDKPREALSLLDTARVPQAPRMAAADPVRWLYAVLCAAEGEIETALRQNNLLVSSEIGIVEERAALLEELAGLEPARRTAAAKALAQFAAFVNGRVFGAALDQARAAEEALPGTCLPACWRGQFLSSMGRHEEAMEDLKRTVARAPSSAQPLIFLGSAYAASGDLDAAVSAMREALRLAPQAYAPSICLALGQLLEQGGHAEAAIDAYEEAAKNPATEAMARNNIAWLHAVSRGKPEQAVPHAERAAALAPNTPAIQDTLGWVYFLNAQHDKAIAPLERARNGLPTNPTIRYHLGAAYLKAGRTAEGVSELRDALSFKADFPESQQAGDLLAQAGAATAP